MLLFLTLDTLNNINITPKNEHHLFLHVVLKVVCNDPDSYKYFLKFNIPLFS